MNNISDEMMYKGDKEKCKSISKFGLYRYKTNNEIDKYKKPKRGKFVMVIILSTVFIVFTSICFIVYSVLFDNSKYSVSVIDINQKETENETISIKNYSNETTVKYEDTFATSTNSSQIPEALALKIDVLESENRRKMIAIPKPFHYELRDPRPTAFRSKPIIHYTKTQEAIPSRHKGQNIQEIIKYLEDHRPVEEDQEEETNGGIKFKGYYKKPRGEMFAASMLNPRKVLPFSKRNNYNNEDPFFAYKPQNPSEVNLLATHNVRFAPFIYELESKKQKHLEDYDDLMPDNSNKKYNERPLDKPISVMLDISAMENIGTRKVRQPKMNPIYSAMLEQSKNKNYYYNTYNYPLKHPLFNNKVMIHKNNLRGLIQDVEKPSPGKMIIHLNLYPRRRSNTVGNYYIPKKSTEKKCIGDCSNKHFAEPFTMNKTGFRTNDISSNQQKVQYYFAEPIYQKQTDQVAQNTEIHVVKNEEQNTASKTELNTEEMIPQTDNLTQPISEYGPLSETQMHKPDVNKINCHDSHGNSEDSEENIKNMPEIYQKYSASVSVPTESNIKWDTDKLEENPNLVHHKATFNY